MIESQPILAIAILIGAALLIGGVGELVYYLYKKRKSK